MCATARFPQYETKWVVSWPHPSTKASIDTRNIFHVLIFFVHAFVIQFVFQPLNALRTHELFCDTTSAAFVRSCLSFTQFPLIRHLALVIGSYVFGSVR